MIFLFIVTTIGLYNYISWYTYRQDLNRYETNSFSTGDPTLNRVCIDLNDNYESNAYFKDRLGLIYNIGKENDTYKIFITPYNNLPINTVNKDCFPKRNVIYYIEPYIIKSSNNLFLAIVIIFFLKSDPIVKQVWMIGNGRKLCPFLFSFDQNNWLFLGDIYMNDTILFIGYSPYKLLNGKLIPNCLPDNYTSNCENVNLEDYRK